MLTGRSVVLYCSDGMRFENNIFNEQFSLYLFTRSYVLILFTTTIIIIIIIILL